MKVLILDVDDVLNCWKTTDVILTPDGTPSWIPGRVPRVAWKGLDEFRVEFIRNIVRKTGCKIVLSTSWRLDDVATEYLKKRLGADIAEHIIGATVDHNGNEPRAVEIEEWIEKHPEVTKFVILDNTEWDDLERFGRSFVQTVTHKGMNEEHMKRVIEILGEE